MPANVQSDPLPKRELPSLIQWYLQVLKLREVVRPSTRSLISVLLMLTSNKCLALLNSTLQLNAWSGLTTDLQSACLSTRNLEPLTLSLESINIPRSRDGTMLGRLLGLNRRLFLWVNRNWIWRIMAYIYICIYIYIYTYIYIYVCVYVYIYI